MKGDKVTSTGSGSWVLIAEDDTDTRQALVEVLCFVGYEVRDAENGQVALDCVRVHGLPSLVLLDLHMPKMDAAEFLQVFWRSAEASKIPVVLLTAVTGAQVLPGCFALLTKPFRLEELLDVVERAVGSRQQQLH